MGHASINITMDVYGHLMKTVNSEAPLKLQNAIFEKNGDFLETLEDDKIKKHSENNSKCLINLGEPRGDRTHDLRIKSD